MGLLVGQCWKSNFSYFKKMFFPILWLHWVFVAARRLSGAVACWLLVVVASLVVVHRL